MPEIVSGLQYPSGHANDGVHAVIMLLDDWAKAIDDERARYWLPDPNYQRSGGRPTWTEEELARLIREIDAEIDQEVSRTPGTQAKVQAQAGSGFVRLPLPQRLALAQQLDVLVTQYEGLFPADTQASA